MDKKTLIKILIILAIPLLTFITPAPQIAGSEIVLPEIGWRLFGVYFATILAIILKPYPLPVILLTAVAIAGIIISITPAQEIADGTKFALKPGDVLGGYSSGTTWLVFAAFAISTAFVSTGLGKRLAYMMIGAFGSTTLRLGYVNACLDALLSPAMPSTTARAGGIMFPIMNSVTVALDSHPDTNPRHAGHYLLLNTYMVVKSTGYLFLTAMAPNAVALELMEPILGIKISWGTWFVAALLPGVLCLLLTPLVVYFLYPPELKKVDNKSIAQKGLEELGPISRREKTLLGLFVVAVLSWMLSDVVGVSASIIAVCVMALTVLLYIIKWEDILNNKGGWNTFIWYGGILGLSAALDKAKFFNWLSELMKSQLNFGDHGNIALIIVLLVSVAVRYLFASGGAYVAAMVPVFSIVGLAAGADPLLLALGLLFSNSYGGAVTHYGSGPAPVIFGAGYVDTKSWWVVGGVVAFGSLLIHCTVGFAWWKMLSGMGIFG